MNREEARLELDATTLRPQDASAESRAMAEQDAELGVWLEKRTAFDEEMSAVLNAATVPAGLRESILQAADAKPVKRRKDWIVTALVAMAACIAIGWQVLWPEFGGLPKWQAESLKMVVQVEHGMIRLDQRAANLNLVKRYLAATGLPSPQHLPGTISGLPTYGCKSIRIGTRPATIICFQMENGKEAHLVIMENAGLAGAPPQLKPEFAASKDWNMAAWSDGHLSFMLATTADAAALKKLFGLV